jgi:hemolysin activation/secretion protein
VLVKGFSFRGNTVFSSKQLAAIADPYLKAHNGLMSAEDFEAVRNALTMAYINRGYINSGAILPDQTIGPDRIVAYQIVEGRLSAIHLRMGRHVHIIEYLAPASRPATVPSEAGHGQSGKAQAPLPSRKPNLLAPPKLPTPNIVDREAAQPPPPSQRGIRWQLLSDSYIADRVDLGAGPPLNVLKLKDELELLRRDPNVKTINGELSPGDYPGESVLDLTVAERNPFQVGVEFANSRPPSVGAYELSAFASDSDLTGHGDSFSARWGVLAGPSNDIAYNSDHDLSFDYILPLTAKDLSLEVNYTRSSDVVVETPFQAVGITSQTDSICGTLRQPFIRTVEDPQLETKDEELAGFVTVSSRYNKTCLLGQPFSLSPGANNGQQNTFAIRPGLEYTRRSVDDAISLRTTFSFGVGGVFDSTINHDGQPDSRFFAFLGQAQYVHRLPLGSADKPWYDTRGIVRFNTQLTPNRLLAVEQFSLGGVDTVRGYRENQLVTDMAVQASVELQIPVVKSRQRDVLSVIPFFDSGYAWNRDNSTATPELISSVGAGLGFTPTDQFNARIYYGYRLKQFSHSSDDLQDMGIYFDVTVFCF